MGSPDQAGGDRYRSWEEPAHRLLWRLAVRLLADHQARSPAPPWQAGTTCHGCGRRWPCEGYRLGQRGLVASLRRRPPQPPHPPR